MVYFSTSDVKSIKFGPVNRLTGPGRYYRDLTIETKEGNTVRCSFFAEKKEDLHIAFEITEGENYEHP